MSLTDLKPLGTILNAVSTKIKGSRGNWNQNDSSADNYIANRTHYCHIGKKKLVDNLTSSEYEEGHNYQCNFVPGQKYTVIWNGQTYDNLVCVLDDGWNVLGDSDSLPFYIDDDGGNNLYISSDEEFTVSIFEHINEVKQLDEKYIPDTIMRTFDVISGGVAKEIAAGLYNDKGELIADWDTLVNVDGFDIEYDSSGYNYRNDPVFTNIMWDKYQHYDSRYFSMVIDDSVTKIGDCAFYLLNNIVDIYLPDGLKSIGQESFTKNGLTEIFIPSSVELINSRAFSQCFSLKKVVFENNSKLKTLGWEAFGICSQLESIDFGDYSELLVIGEDAFSECYELSSVNFGKKSKLTTIEEYAFSSCHKITEMTLPETIKEIGNSAFGDLTTLTVLAKEPPVFGGGGYYFNRSIQEIRVPRDSVEAYKTAEEWDEYADKIVPIEG